MLTDYTTPPNQVYEIVTAGAELGDQDSNLDIRLQRPLSYH